MGARYNSTLGVPEFFIPTSPKQRQLTQRGITIAINSNVGQYNVRVIVRAVAMSAFTFVTAFASVTASVTTFLTASVTTSVFLAWPCQCRVRVIDGARVCVRVLVSVVIRVLRTVFVTVSAFTSVTAFASVTAFVTASVTNVRDGVRD